MKDGLVTKFQNGKGEDISHIMRGRIIAIEEILTLDKAIDGYLENEKKLNAWKATEELKKGKAVTEEGPKSVAPAL